MADAVIGAKASQKTPEGYYSIERMLKRVLAAKGQVLLCATCMDARGLTDAEIMPGGEAQQHGRASRRSVEGRPGAGVLTPGRNRLTRPGEHIGRSSPSG
jgi:hypothetical protein